MTSGDPLAALDRSAIEKALECPLCGGFWFKGRCRDCRAEFDSKSGQVIRPEPEPAQTAQAEPKKVGLGLLDWLQ